MGIIGGRYRYIEDLLALDSCRPLQSDLVPIWPRGPTPVSLPVLLPYLKCHPDQQLAAFVYNGLGHGFRIGFDRQHALKSNRRNHPSSVCNNAVVESTISMELTQGRLVGPLPQPAGSHVQVSPVGLVPKPHSEKFRMIVDLSSPKGLSVNDGIDENLCSLQYASVDNAVDGIRQLGRGAQLVKMDLQNAYRLIPVHPYDQHLLAIRWNDQVYIDRNLPFGLRSAPKLFTAFADVVAWAIHCCGVRYILHYLDDFLIMGAPNSSEATIAASKAMEFFSATGIPVADHKTEGPATSLTFLGVLIDTDRFQLRLPEDKLLRLRELVMSWQSKKSCTRKELESFVGHLAHAAVVIRPGRIFLRSLYALLAGVAKSHFYIRLNIAVRADLQWWYHFLQCWNGSSFFPLPVPSAHVYSDASGSFGCGAFDPSHGWFQLQWPPQWASVEIVVKEMVPIVVAAAVWGPLWEGRHICFHSDNMAVVAVLNKGSTKDHLLLHFLRCLYFYAAFYKFHYSAVHIPGVLNTAADALSRHIIYNFSSFIPQATPCAVPSVVQNFLLWKTPDWISAEWTRLFCLSLVRESPGVPLPPTIQA